MIDGQVFLWDGDTAYVSIDVIQDRETVSWFRRFIALSVLKLLAVLNPTFAPLELKGGDK
jgi:hypothetical protein